MWRLWLLQCPLNSIDECVFSKQFNSSLSEIIFHDNLRLNATKGSYFYLSIMHGSMLIKGQKELPSHLVDLVRSRSRQIVCKTDHISLQNANASTMSSIARTIWQLLHPNIMLSIFCETLIHSIHFPIVNSSMGWVGNLAFQDSHSALCALCHCPLLSEWGCSTDNQISQHALHWLRCSRMETLSDIYDLCHRIGETGR